MDNYLINIKSHCEAPDYEDEVRANSLDEAVELFKMRINQYPNEDYWGNEDLKPFVIKEL